MNQLGWYKIPPASCIYPIGSMYAIYANIYHQYTPNVSIYIYTIHGSYGYIQYTDIAPPLLPRHGGSAAKDGTLSIISTCWRPGDGVWDNYGKTVGNNYIDNQNGYGSIPINTIFRGMNIHLPAILMFTRGTRFWHTAKLENNWKTWGEYSSKSNSSPLFTISQCHLGVCQVCLRQTLKISFFWWDGENGDKSNVKKTIEFGIAVHLVREWTVNWC